MRKTPRAERVLATAALLLTASALHAQPAPPEVVWSQTTSAAALAFTPDGSVLASGGSRGGCGQYVCGQITFWQSADGTPITTLTQEASGDDLGFTSDLAFTPDGTRFASSHGAVGCPAHGGCYPDSPGLFLRAYPSLAEISGVTGFEAIPYAVDITPDGSRLAAGMGYDNQGVVQLYDAPTLTPTGTLPGHQYTTNDVAYAPDGSRLATVGDDGDLRVWDVVSNSLLYAVPHEVTNPQQPWTTIGGEPSTVAFSPDGALVATGGGGYGGGGHDNRVRLWNATDGTLLRTFDGQIDSTGTGSYGGQTVVVFSPNGAYLIAGVSERFSSGTRAVLRFWDVTTGDVAAEYVVPLTGDVLGVRALAFSPGLDSLFAYAAASTLYVTRTALHLADPVVPTAGAPSPELPAGFALSAVYPNPFNPSARFTLAVEQAQAVRVAVFDALGREVAVLHDGVLASGAARLFEVDGSRLPSGAYVVRAVGETFAASRRVTLLR